MGVYHSFDCTLVYFLGSKKEKKNPSVAADFKCMFFFFNSVCVCVCVCVFIPCSGEIDTLRQNSVCFQ